MMRARRIDRYVKKGGLRRLYFGAATSCRNGMALLDRAPDDQATLRP